MCLSVCADQHARKLNYSSICKFQYLCSMEIAGYWELYDIGHCMIKFKAL